MPPVNPIFKMFGRSPIRPMQEHMQKAHEASKKLMDYFTAVLDLNWQKADEIRALIVQCEHEADDLKRDIRAHLPKNLFLPVPREDLLEILSKQDRIANKAKDIVGLVSGRKMHIPSEISASYVDLLKHCIYSTKITLKAINEIDELLETGFRGNEVEILQEMIDEIVKIEHNTDEIQVQLHQELFAIEKELNPIEAIFLYKLIDWTGDLADRAEQVANHIQLLLAR